MKDKEKIKRIEKLTVLSLSKEYQSDFKKLKEEILLKKEKFYYYTGWPVNFDKAEVNRLGRREYDKKHPSRISSEEVNVLFKEGNVNDHLISIPNNYSDFKKRWDLQYFFDPLKDYPEGLDPFQYRFPVIPCLGPIHKGRKIPNDPNLLVIRHKEFFDPEDDCYKAWLEIDIREPMKVLHQKIDKIIHWHKRERGSEIKSPQGRPRKRHTQLKEMMKIWEKYCKGRQLGDYEQSQMIYEALRETHGDDTPQRSTINRSYLPMIKKEIKNR